MKTNKNYQLISIINYPILMHCRPNFSLLLSAALRLFSILHFHLTTIDNLLRAPAKGFLSKLPCFRCILNWLLPFLAKFSAIAIQILIILMSLSLVLKALDFCVFICLSFHLLLRVYFVFFLQGSSLLANDVVAMLAFG